MAGPGQDGCGGAPLWEGVLGPYREALLWGSGWGFAEPQDSSGVLCLEGTHRGGAVGMVGRRGHGGVEGCSQLVVGHGITRGMAGQGLMDKVDTAGA